MPRQISSAPAPGLDLVVVIPCHDEPDVLLTLKDLRHCEDSGRVVEVIVVVNASESAGDDVRQRNANTLRNIRDWTALQVDDWRFRIHALDFPDLPARHAGVGLARKLGMDEALARIAESGGEDGIIVSLDADCRVDGNYLAAIARHFDRSPVSPACSVYFEHPLNGPLSERHYRAIVDYELYLRYYRHGLLYAGHPCAHYTVGSAMAVRGSAYARQGGMNRRKGAEDFYFLNKLMLIGNFSELLDTAVYPSPRHSHRVPFGTGRAIGDVLADSARTLEVYGPQAFDDLAALISRIDTLARNPAAALSELSDVMNGYLVAHGVHDKLPEIIKNTATAASFRGRFFRWFDGFRALKFVRHASAQVYGTCPVDHAALALLQRRRLFNRSEASARELLLHYRCLDRNGASTASMP